MALSEQEVIYLIKMHKDKIEKFRSTEVLEQTYNQAAFTAKLLTKEMVECSIPICLIIQKHMESRITREEVLLILYRCKQLYSVRTEVQKILHLLIKAQYDPSGEQPSRDKQLRLW